MPDTIGILVIVYLVALVIGLFIMSVVGKGEEE